MSYCQLVKKGSATARLTVDFVTVVQNWAVGMQERLHVSRRRYLTARTYRPPIYKQLLLPFPDPTSLPTTAATLLVTYRASPFAPAASTLAAHVATLRRIKVLKKGPKINKTCYKSNTGVTSCGALRPVAVKATVLWDSGAHRHHVHSLHRHPSTLNT